jgi:hypothetical protein
MMVQEISGIEMLTTVNAALLQTHELKSMTTPTYDTDGK